MWRGCLAVPALFSAILFGEPFSGSVIEEHSAKPIRGARVQVRIAGASRMTADLETGAGGTFRAAVDLPAGEYRVDITKPNYADATLRLRIPLQGPLAVRLVRFGSISGRITDTQNRPMGRATVLPMVADANGQFRRVSIGASAQADDTGRYRLYNLPPGRYAVAVSWATMNPTSVSGTYLFPNNQRPEMFPIASGAMIQGIDFVLPAQSEYSVTGRVQLADASKRSAVTLVLWEQPSLAAAMVLTEPDGSFRLEGIAPGAYELMTAAPTTGYAGFGAVLDSEPVFARSRIDVGGQHVTGINVSPEPGRTIRLSLESAVGCPASASILLEALENWGALLHNRFDLTTAREVAVKDLAPGRYRVVVSKPAHNCFGAQDRIVDFRTVESVRIEIVPGGTVEGRIESSAGKTPAVALTALDAPEPSAQLALPDGDGRFRFLQLRPGRYRVRAEAASQDITVHGNAITQVALRSPENRP